MNTKRRATQQEQKKRLGTTAQVTARSRAGSLDFVGGWPKKQFFKKTKKMIKMKNQKTKKPIYKTWYNATEFPDKGEINTEPSMTIPNETYSLREIVEKFSREYPKHLLRQGYYDGDENMEDFDDVDVTRQPDFDYVDAQELKENINKKQKQKPLPKKPEKQEKTENSETSVSEV